MVGSPPTETIASSDAILGTRAKKKKEVWLQDQAATQRLAHPIVLATVVTYKVKSTDHFRRYDILEALSGDCISQIVQVCGDAGYKTIAMPSRYRIVGLTGYRRDGVGL